MQFINVFWELEFDCIEVYFYGLFLKMGVGYVIDLVVQLGLEGCDLVIIDIEEILV